MSKAEKPTEEESGIQAVTPTPSQDGEEQSFISSALAFTNIRNTNLPEIAIDAALRKAEASQKPVVTPSAIAKINKLKNMFREMSSESVTLTNSIKETLRQLKNNQKAINEEARLKPLISPTIDKSKMWIDFQGQGTETLISLETAEKTQKMHKKLQVVCAAILDALEEKEKESHAYIL